MTREYLNVFIHLETHILNNKNDNACCISALVKITDWTPEYYISNKSDCNAVLESANALMEIPMLNSEPLDNFKNQQLVRFRGMIQDMHNPEYYFKQYEVKNIQTEMLEVRCGMYTDCVKCLVTM